MEEWSVVISVVTASLFLTVLGFQIWATFLSRKTAQAAKESSLEARKANEMLSEEMSLRIRPWLSARHPDISGIEDSDGHRLASKNPDTGMVELTLIMRMQDFVAVFEIPIVNFGQFPAYSVGVATGKSFDRGDAEAEMQGDLGPMGGSVLPGETLRHRMLITKEDYFVFRGEDPQPFYISCGLTYADREGHFWKSEATYQLEGPTVVSVRESTPVAYTVESKE